MTEAELVYKVKDRTYTEGHTPTTWVEHMHYVRGMHGGVAFVWAECLQPENLPDIVAWLREPQGRDLGYHRRERTHDWQHESEECIVTGGVCYYDGSSLNADRLMKEWFAVGKDESYLRAHLARYYHEVFYDLFPADDVQAMTFNESMVKLSEVLGLLDE